MIIKDLELQNFRRFGRFVVDFHDELTVIVARNGKGKTTVLDGVSMALGTFVGAFDHGKARHIEKSDARLLRLNDLPEGSPQYPVSLGAHFSAPNGLSIINMKVFRELTGPKNKTTVKGAYQITGYGEYLQGAIRTDANIALPIVAYYGAGRLWRVHKNMERKQVVSADRTMGYEDCLSPSSNFVQCQQWMAKATLARQQEMEVPEAERPTVTMADRIAAIQDAVNNVLEAEGWSRFTYSFAYEELAMFSPNTGFMPVSMLSDGVRAMVSLVADIAFRCVRLNGYLGRRAPRETKGIVLVDEIDIHLHPAWQQRVIGTLRAAFPQIQFIVSTHSPQVLTSVDATCIRSLSEEIADETGVIDTVSKHIPQQTQGVASSNLLAEVMGVNPIPDIAPAKWVDDYNALIQQGMAESAEAAELRTQLIGHFGPDHPVLRESDRLIRLSYYKSRLPAPTRTM